MNYHNEAAILCPQSAAVIKALSRTSGGAGICLDCGFCPAPQQPVESPHRVGLSPAWVAPVSNRSRDLSVLETQDVFGTFGVGFERLRISHAASEAEGDAAMGHRLEIVDYSADHRPTEWERHDAR